MLSFKNNQFFTKRDQLIIIILIVVFIVSCGINIYKHLWSNNKKYTDYDQELIAFENKINTVIQKDILLKKNNNIQTDNYKAIQKKKELSLSLDINKATKEELEQLPYIGPVTAQRIVDYRTQVGRFKTVDELINVKGIGKKKINRVKSYIKIEN